MSSLNTSSLIERRPLLTVSINTPISEAMQIMAKNRMTAVCVMRRDKLVGIFTMKDVMTKVLGYKTASLWKTPKKRKIKDVPVRVLMSSEPHTITHLDKLDHALALMKKHRVRHLPVMKEDTLLGLITLRDVIEGMRAQDNSSKTRTPSLESMYYENLYQQAVTARHKHT